MQGDHASIITKVKFDLSSLSGSKKSVPDEMVQEPTGTTEAVHEGTEPLCQEEEEEDTLAGSGCQALEGG